MGTIIYIMGKSASGKDTVYRELLRRFPSFRPLIPYTTRPKRLGEQEGEEYHFTDPETLKKLALLGKVVEQRVYETVAGPWVYATVDDPGMAEEGSVWLGIGTLESFRKLREFYGSEQVIPIYLEADDGACLERALHREQKQEKPNYAELCRRFLADLEDFSEEKLAEAGIGKRYRNVCLSDCLADIAGDVIHYA